MLEEAGIDLGGVLGLPVTGEFPNPGYKAPALVELAGNRVRWQFWREDELAVWGPVRGRGASAGALKDLLSIRDGEDVVRFVSRHGPLWLCSQHGIRGCRDCARPPREFIKLGSGGWGDEDDPPPDVAAARHPQEEPVEGYKFYSSVAGALLRVIAHVEAGKVADVDDIFVLYQWRFRDDWGWPFRMRPDEVTRDDVHKLFIVTPRDGSSGKPLTGAELIKFRLLWSRVHLAEALNHWLELGAPGPRLNPAWCAEPMLAAPVQAMLLMSADAFGAIGLELLAAAVGGDVAICSLCGRPYPRRIGPKRTRNNYCLDCRGKPANAARQRKHRQRLAAGEAVSAAAGRTSEPQRPSRADGANGRG